MYYINKELNNIFNNIMTRTLSLSIGWSLCSVCLTDDSRSDICPSPFTLQMIFTGLCSLPD